MTASMTAFSRIESETTEGRLVWEIRSVNHRFLDAHLRLPDELKSLESGCRQRIGKCLNRGRIDAGLKFERNQMKYQQASLNKSALAALQDAISQVRQILPDAAKVSPTEILRWPGVLNEPEEDFEKLHVDALQSLDKALEELVTARNREGDKMGLLISERITASRELVSRFRTELPAIENDIKQRWQQRMNELGEQVEPTRLAQEMAIMLTRSDVNEELDRLDSHFDEVDYILASTEPVGRKLDFLMQELNREANTLGSKAADLRNTSASVDLKILIDQMREQVQNIE